MNCFQKMGPQSLPSTSKRHRCEGRPADRIHRIQTTQSVRQSEMNEGGESDNSSSCLGLEIDCIVI